MKEMIHKVSLSFCSLPHGSVVWHAQRLSHLSIKSQLTFTFSPCSAKHIDPYIYKTARTYSKKQHSNKQQRKISAAYMLYMYIFNQIQNRMFPWFDLINIIKKIIYAVRSSLLMAHQNIPPAESEGLCGLKKNNKGKKSRIMYSQSALCSPHCESVSIATKSAPS